MSFKSKLSVKNLLDCGESLLEAYFVKSPPWSKSTQEKSWYSRYFVLWIVHRNNEEFRFITKKVKLDIPKVHEKPKYFLIYWENRSDRMSKMPIGIMPLSDNCNPSSREHPYWPEKIKHVFAVDVSDRRLFLCAENEDKRELWLSYLQACFSSPMTKKKAQSSVQEFHDYALSTKKDFDQKVDTQDKVFVHSPDKEDTTVTEFDHSVDKEDTVSEFIHTVDKKEDTVSEHSTTSSINSRGSIDSNSPQLSLRRSFSMEVLGEVLRSPTFRDATQFQQDWSVEIIDDQKRFLNNERSETSTLSSAESASNEDSECDVKDERRLSDKCKDSNHVNVIVEESIENDRNEEEQTSENENNNKSDNDNNFQKLPDNDNDNENNIENLSDKEDAIITDTAEDSNEINALNGHDDGNDIVNDIEANVNNIMDDTKDRTVPTLDHCHSQLMRCYTSEYTLMGSSAEILNDDLNDQPAIKSLHSAQDFSAFIRSPTSNKSERKSVTFSDQEAFSNGECDINDEEIWAPQPSLKKQYKAPKVRAKSNIGYSSDGLAKTEKRKVEMRRTNSVCSYFEPKANYRFSRRKPVKRRQCSTNSEQTAAQWKSIIAQKDDDNKLDTTVEICLENVETRFKSDSNSQDVPLSLGTEQEIPTELNKIDNEKDNVIDLQDSNSQNGSASDDKKDKIEDNHTTTTTKEGTKKSIKDKNASKPIAESTRETNGQRKEIQLTEISNLLKQLDETAGQRDTTVVEKGEQKSKEQLERCESLVYNVPRFQTSLSREHSYRVSFADVCLVVPETTRIQIAHDELFVETQQAHFSFRMENIMNEVNIERCEWIQGASSEL